MKNYSINNLEKSTTLLSTGEESISNDLYETLHTKNMFSVKELCYTNSIRNLDVESSGEVKSKKSFPVFLDEFWKEQIFKPLSKTKPYLTPLFAYSEVFWSNIIHHYFDNKAPLYQLSLCKGISEHQPKYYEKWTLVPSILDVDQKLVNLLEHFRENPDPKVDIDSYVNYCMIPYDYIPILKSQFFINNAELSHHLVQQIFLSILMKNQNFHYENLAFICKGDDVISLAPPIDHEFSSFFMFPDDKKQYNFYTTAYFLSLTHQNWVLFHNLCFIVKTYPEFSEEFLQQLQQLQQDLLKKPLLIEDYNYLEECSSQEFEIWQARLKEMDEKKAKFLEQNLCRKKIDIQNFSSVLERDLLRHIDTLISMIEIIQKT